ncbi:hypothetical protein [Aromatoleum anaerobium]|uniref:Helix-turn-helix domain-containing protein n=1 Tax=Aromatoleum anaerobium TaxID=182180 RepID=A0ABX1PQ80_9RHOO|nr:hypothetical protein [Aromatoleum anaerobium]MCK0506334.1 helix-turn-helix domain-containing protein [Aromatoleum anaerobium]
MTPSVNPALAPVTLSREAEAQLVFWAAPEESIHSAATVAAVTELATNTLQNFRVSGEGPDYIKRGGKIYYRKTDVISWMRGEDPRRRANAPH